MQCGYEVPLANGYIADWVSLCGMQHRYERQYLSERQFERRNGILVSPEFACVFETKISRSDFMTTFGLNRIVQSGRSNPVGNLHWVVIPKLQTPMPIHLLPPQWGVLIEAGRGLRELIKPKFCHAHKDIIYGIAYHILWYGKERPG